MMRGQTGDYSGFGNACTKKKSYLSLSLLLPHSLLKMSFPIVFVQLDVDEVHVYVQTLLFLSLVIYFIFRKRERDKIRVRRRKGIMLSQMRARCVRNPFHAVWFCKVAC